MIARGRPLTIENFEIEFQVFEGTIGQYEGAFFRFPIKKGNQNNKVEVKKLSKFLNTLTSGNRDFEVVEEWAPVVANIRGASACIAGDASKAGTIVGFDPHFLEPFIEVTASGGLTTGHYVTSNVSLFLA